MIINDGKYVSAKTAKTGESVRILDEGSIQENTKYKYDDGSPRMDYIFTVEYNGEKSLLRMNKASRTACVEAWGKDTVLWVDKIAHLFVMPTPNGGEKMIILQPVIPVNPSNVRYEP